MPTLHASPDWAHPSTTTTTRPAPITVTAVTPAPTTSSTVPADAADVVLQPGPAVSDVVLLPATVTGTAPPPVLPHTGADTADMAAAAVCLIFAGGLAILTARRIRRTESDKR